MSFYYSESDSYESDSSAETTPNQSQHPPGCIVGQPNTEHNSFNRDDSSGSDDGSNSSYSLVANAPVQPRGKTFRPPAGSDSEDDDEDEVSNFHIEPTKAADRDFDANEEVIQPNTVVPRGKELRLTKKILGADDSSDDEMLATRKKVNAPKTNAPSSNKKSSTGSKKSKSSSKKKTASSSKKKKKIIAKKEAAALTTKSKAKSKSQSGNSKKRKEAPQPVPLESDSDSDDDGVVAAVVVEESDSDNDAIAVAQPIKSPPNKKAKTKDSKAAKKSSSNKSDTKKGTKRLAKKKSSKSPSELSEASTLANESSSVALPVVHAEKAEAAQQARNFLQEVVTRLPYAASVTHIVRSFGRIKPEYGVPPLEALFSSPHAIHPVGFSCDRFEFSPVHGRVIKLRCEILDGSVLRKERLKVKTENKTEPCIINQTEIDGATYNDEDLTDGPVFRIMWGDGVEDEELMEPSFPFDPYASSAYLGGDVDAVAVPLSSKRPGATSTPEVGMRVSVRFDQCKMYGGTITKVSPVVDTSGSSAINNSAFNISIQYDDGVTEDTSYPDPDIYLTPPGCTGLDSGNVVVTELRGRAVCSVLAKTALEAWGRALISLGLIDEAMYDDALDALRTSREEAMIEAKDKKDLANKQRREARARDKQILNKINTGSSNDKGDEAGEGYGQSVVDGYENETFKPSTQPENQSLRETQLREKISELQGVLEGARARLKSASVNLANVRISTISPFAFNPFVASEESYSQEIAWMSAAVKKEKSKMGNTGNKRKIVTPVSMMEKSDTFFIPEIERLVEGLPGTEFTPSYVFHKNRAVAGAASQAWVHEAKVRHQQEQQKKLEKELKVAKEAEVKAKLEHEKEMKRKIREEERDTRKRQKEEEEEKKKKERIEKRLAHLSLQIDDRLFKESCATRERIITNFVKGVNKELMRRRRAAEVAVGHKIEQSSMKCSLINSHTALEAFREMLPPLSRPYDEEVIRIWDFMHSFQGAFSDNFSIPSLDCLQNAIDCVKTESCDEQKRLDALALLKNIAISLCKVSSPSLTKILVSPSATNLESNGSKGLPDGPQQDTDVAYLPVTELTWREIARMLFLSDVLIDLGFSKQESANILKGHRSGGHPSSKEAKRLKKIDDAPLVMMYQQFERQMNVLPSYKMRTMTARVSIPCMPSCLSSDWLFYLHNIKSRPSCSQSLVKTNIEKSLSALKKISVTSSPAGQNVESHISDLEHCLAVMERPGLDKIPVQELDKVKDIILNTIDSTREKCPAWVAGHSENSVYNQKQVLTSKQNCDTSREPIRQRTGFLKMYQLTRDQYRDSELSKEEYMAAALRLKEELDRKNNNETVDEDDDDDDDDEEDDTNLNKAEVVSTTTAPSVEDKKETESTPDISANDVSLNQTKGCDMSQEPSSPTDLTGAPNPEKTSSDLKGNDCPQPGADTSAIGGAPVDREVCGTKTDYEFCQDDPSAPDLLRRCLAVIRTLCTSNSAEPFIYPVDPQLYPGYYESVMNPMSLYDVGRYLQEQNKQLSQKFDVSSVENIVASFGRRVRTIVHNSLCYNSGITTVNSAEEMIRIFERLFFDWVLAPSKQKPALRDLDDDRCVEHHESDLTSMVLLCDGCEGKYNMTRLNPPLDKVPVGDWYCPRCISGRCWATVDPRIGKKVRIGSLSGIVESCKFIFPECGEPDISYTIRVANSGLKESWKLNDVDSAIVGETVEPLCSLQALAESPGYGYGQDHGVLGCALPIPVNPLVGDSAAQASLSSGAFRDTISACITLMNPPDELAATDWTTLLMLLALKCSSSDAVLELSSSLESKAAEGLSVALANFNKHKSAKDFVSSLSDDDSVFSNDHAPDPACGEDEDNNKKLKSSSDGQLPPTTIVIAEEKYVENGSSIRQNKEASFEVDKNNQIAPDKSSSEATTSVENIRKKYEVVSLTKSRREKKREEALMGLFVGSRLKSTAASFEEDVLTSTVNSMFCRQDDGLNLASVRCREVCQYCGLTDVALGAPLCRVPNEMEWKEAFPHAVHNRATFMVAVLNGPLVKNGRKRHKRSATETSETSESSSSCKFLTVRVRVAGDLISSKTDCLDLIANNSDLAMQQFLPKNSHGFQSELKFRYEHNLSFFSGSLTAHEVCASAAHRSRKQKFLQEQKSLHESNLSREAAVSCGKSIPIGVDNYGRSYWKLSAEPKSLFISEPVSLHGDDKPSRKKWYRYHKVEEIASIIACLGKEDPCELLKNIFPEANQLVKNRTWQLMLQNTPPSDWQDFKKASKCSTKDSSCDGTEGQADEDNGPPFVKDEEVLVESESGKFLWDAIVVDVSKDVATEKVNGYFVHYNQWSSRFDQWVPPERVVEPSENNLLVQEEVLEDFRRSKEVPPPELEGLFAFKFLNARNRARVGPVPTSEIYGCVFMRQSASQDEKCLGILKGAILLIEAALPLGSIRSSEYGFWNQQAAAVWRTIVKNSTGPGSLMGCVLLLEDIIHPDWLHPQVSQLFAAIPKRCKAMSEASLPSIALRVSLLDNGLKYKLVDRNGTRS